MTTAERAEALASAAAGFPELGPPPARDLMNLVRLELGHERALEEFFDHGGHRTMAVAPGRILHIVSGNTPHAAFQSMLRGLLLGAMNWVKFPSAGIERLENFGRRLPDSLRERLVIERTLPEAWLAGAEAWVVFGNDATVAHFRALCPPGRTFQAHGSRVGIGVVFHDPDFDSVRPAARDVALFDQLGCLSIQNIFVAGDVAQYGRRLAEALDEWVRQEPPGAIPLEARESLAAARDLALFDEARGAGTKVFASDASLDWTVVCENDALFRYSPGYRFVYVKPMPADWTVALGGVRGHLGAVGIHPCEERHAVRLTGLGPSRICALGKMQDPPFTWHAEGRPNLGDLVRWVDFEAGS